MQEGASLSVASRPSLQRPMESTEIGRGLILHGKHEHPRSIAFCNVSAVGEVIICRKELLMFRLRIDVLMWNGFVAVCLPDRASTKVAQASKCRQRLRYHLSNPF